MDTEQMMKELVESPKYKERADVRTVVDEAVDGLRGQTSKERVKEVLDALKEKLAAVLGLPPVPGTEPKSSSQPRGVAEFGKYIDTLPMTKKQKEKLKEMVGSYDESVEAAKEVDPSVTIKPIQEVLGEVMKLGLDKLKEIADFARPAILVTPKNSFLEKKAEMNKHKPYLHTTDGKPQEDAYHWDNPNSPYKSVSTPAKTTISITDTATHMQHIPGIAPDSRFDQRKAAFKAHFEGKGIKMINIHEYAVLMQRSLREYEKSGKDVLKIVDYYEGTETVTCLDDEYLTSSTNVAFGYFSPRDRQVRFGARGPAYAFDRLRGRPSVQVMKY